MDVKLPNLGEGADSGSVVAIHVKEGDSIEQGQTILDLENEKAVAPIPSPAAGRISKILAKEGSKLSVGQTILVLEPANGSAPAPASAPKAESPTQAPSPASTVPRQEPAHAAVPAILSEAPSDSAARKAGLALAASPTLRRIARDLGIDLHRIKGSQPGGRITTEDVKGYILHLQALALKPQAGAAKAPGPAVESVDFGKWGSILKKPMTSLRQTIARRLQESWNVIPHVTQFDEADITDLNALRKAHASAYEAKGAKITLTSFALKAVVAALKKYPIFNASIDEVAHEIILKEYYHIGLAVDTDAGLLVPVLRDVDKKDLLQLSKEVNEFAEKARDRKVSVEEMRGGTFTISNQGGIGGAHFTPIVNRPEVAILGLGRGQLKPVVRGGKIEPRLMMPICISYDHRIIDGGTAARFCNELVEAFQSFKEQDIKL